MKIILDTNMLMAVAQFKVDVFAELERLCDFSYTTHVLSGTITELEDIVKRQKGKHKRAAQLALQIIKKKKINILPSKGDVDDVLVWYSAEGSLIATQDVLLKKRLTKPIITMRGKKYLIIVS
jgi:rRNA-processing protein FCF1